MKALFLVYHGFNPANGISKKISYQVEALKQCGVETKLCYLDETTGEKRRMADDDIICNYGGGIKGKILKRIEFDSIVSYIKKEGIRFVYVRSDLNANPLTIRLMKRMRQAGCAVVMEIPTYPYDQEIGSASRKWMRRMDVLFRHALAKQLNAIVTFSNYDQIFGTPTIRISNGIDFSQIKLKTDDSTSSEELHLIGVAEIHYWHGFDRLIRGLVDYYASQPTLKVFFHLVGAFFSDREKTAIMSLIEANHIKDYVILHGSLHGEALDAVFEKADMAVGSLGRHRSGITHIKTLKNREYAARGLSFVYSETDADFEEMPYILKCPADESPVDIKRLIAFKQSQSMTASEIRNSIQHLSWQKQMEKVLQAVQNPKTLSAGKL